MNAPAAPAVRHLTVDEESDGQRLDNFLLRELKGIGLKEAKEAVDDYAPGRQPGDVSVVQPGGHGGIFWLLSLFALGAAVAWLLGAF